MDASYRNVLLKPCPLRNRDIALRDGRQKIETPRRPLPDRGLGFPSAKVPCAHAPREKIPTTIFSDKSAAVAVMAEEIQELIERENRRGVDAVLGFDTGRTCFLLYEELVRRHRENGLSFQNVVSFNLSDYYGLSPVHPRSLSYSMAKRFFDRVDLPPENIHVLNGFFPKNQRENLCRRYEEKISQAGGIALQILGIGRSGRVGFNEPGATKKSRTRRSLLNPFTRQDAAAEFEDEISVPYFGMTMGIGSILEARQIVLMGWGTLNAGVVAEAIEGPMTEKLPASFLQGHRGARVVLDREAAALLSRFHLRENNGGKVVEHP